MAAIHTKWHSYLCIIFVSLLCKIYFSRHFYVLNVVLFNSVNLISFLCWKKAKYRLISYNSSFEFPPAYNSNRFFRVCPIKLIIITLIYFYFYVLIFNLPLFNQSERWNSNLSAIFVIIIIYWNCKI